MKKCRYKVWVGGAACLLFGLLIVALDYFSKTYIHTHIPLYGTSGMDFPYGGMGLFQGLLGGIDFSINQVLNRGAAWGIFSQYQDLLIYLRLVLIGAVVVYLAFFNASVARAFFLTLVVAGALGNVIDYFKYGYVIDFFHFKFWGYSYPLFNIADIAICVGVILLIIHTLAFSDPQRAGHKTKTKRCK